MRSSPSKLSAFGRRSSATVPSHSGISRPARTPYQLSSSQTVTQLVKTKPPGGKMTYKKKHQIYKKKLSKSPKQKAKIRRTYSLNGPIKKGTGTNDKIRKWVNNPKTFVPSRFTEQYSYKSDSGKMKTVFFESSNPPYKSGKWDAGHIQGNQMGGSGTSQQNIFPQNPAVNRWGKVGRKYVSKRSHKWRNPSKKSRLKNIGLHMGWREWEDKKVRKAKKYGKLHNIKFKAYAK